MSARDRILNRVRAALGPDSAAELPPPATARRDDLGTRDALVAAFREALEAVGGVVHLVRDVAGAAEVLPRIVAEHHALSLALSDAPDLVSLTRALPSSVLRLEPGCDLEALLAAGAGLTGAQGAIAETGTLVLDSTAERHRLVSLVPPVHIAVLDSGSIVPTLGQALTSFGAPPPPTLTFITGPSRTADIELELVIGVHGPKALEVILIDGD